MSNRGMFLTRIMRSAEQRPPVEPITALTSIGATLYEWDIGADSIAWAPNAHEVLGTIELQRFSSASAYDLAIDECIGPRPREAIAGCTTPDEGDGVAYQLRYVLRTGPDRLVRVEDTGRWFADAEGRPAFARGMVRIESGGESMGECLRSRSLFLQQITEDVSEAIGCRHSMTLIVGAVECEHSFEAAPCGETVLNEIGRRLRVLMRRRDRFITFADGRFALALVSCPASTAETALQRLLASIETEPMATPDGPVRFRARLGAASAPEHASDAPSLFRCAEEALAAAELRQAAFSVFSAEATPERPPSGTSPFDVVDALNDRRLVIARQPVIDALTRKRVFSTALIRLRDIGGNTLPAGDLTLSMERAGLTQLLDARVLELAADYLAANPTERLAFRISPATLADGEWLTILAAHLGARPGIESRLIVEVPEAAAIRDPHLLKSRLDAMKALGIAVAIGGFGSGRVPFKYLRNLPIDMLLIDGRFTQNLARSTDDRLFVRALVDLAHHLGIATVAEWVEDEPTAKLLAGWGVDYLQGGHCGASVLVDGELATPRRAGTA